MFRKSHLRSYSHLPENEFIIFKQRQSGKQCILALLLFVGVIGLLIGFFIYYGNCERIGKIIFEKIKDDIELKNLFNQINQRAYRDLYNTKELKLVLLTDYLRHGVRINLMDIIDLIDIDKLSKLNNGLLMTYNIYQIDSKASKTRYFM